MAQDLHSFDSSVLLVRDVAGDYRTGSVTLEQLMALAITMTTQRRIQPRNLRLLG